MRENAEKRRQEIAEYVSENKKIKVSDIVERYGISGVSARNDLEILENEDVLRRVHGGAVSISKQESGSDFDKRYKTNSAYKKELAKEVAKLIEDNDTVMMNAGTTLTYILRAIHDKKNVSIVTNSLPNTVEALDSPDFNVILLGGQIDPKYRYTFGSDALSQLEKYHANKCIISVDGVNAQNGLTLYYSSEVDVIKKMIDCSDTCIVAVTKSKIGKNTFASVAPITDVDILVTNKSEKTDEIAAIKENGVKVYES